MPNPVMVPLDGSEKDALALAVAPALADLADAGLHLVRVVDTAIGSASAPAGALGAVVAPAEPRDAVRRSVAASADRVAADTGRPVTWDVLDGADAADVLTQHAAERDVRFVVMATRAPGKAGRALRGSVADRVMRESPRPVVLVPPGTDDMRGRHVQVGRVLVPLDGSALAARSIDYLLELPRARGLEYVLLEVVPRGDGPARTRAEEGLDFAASRMHESGVGMVETRVVEASEPADAIVSTVRDALVDLIAMSTRGEGGLRRMVLGSVAEGVVRSSEVPVMLLTPTDLGVSDEP